MVGNFVSLVWVWRKKTRYLISFSCLLGFLNKNTTSYKAFAKCWLLSVCNRVFWKYPTIPYDFATLVAERGPFTCQKSLFWSPTEPLSLIKRASFGKQRCVSHQKTTIWLIKWPFWPLIQQFSTTVVASTWRVWLFYRQNSQKIYSTFFLQNFCSCNCINVFVELWKLCSDSSSKAFFAGLFAYIGENTYLCNNETV